MIRVSGLSLRAGSFALRDVSFEVPEGGCAALMGRTGAGKTSILEAICGLRPVESGRVELAGRDVSGLEPSERGVGYVPQDRALFRAMNVAENLGFALRVAGRPTDGVPALAERLGIRGLLERGIDGLSGGEAQRVALGRALAAGPRVLCLDEPLAALDDETRDGLIKLLARIRQESRVTMLYVTHSREEAVRLADRVFRLEDGVLA